VSEFAGDLAGAPAASLSPAAFVTEAIAKRGSTGSL
jgi:hypothetical protein